MIAVLVGSIICFVAGFWLIASSLRNRYDPFFTQSEMNIGMFVSLIGLVLLFCWTYDVKSGTTNAVVVEEHGNYVVLNTAIGTPAYLKANLEVGDSVKLKYTQQTNLFGVKHYIFMLEK